MNVEALTDLEILKESTLSKVIGNEDFENELRMKAKHLRVTGAFEKKLKAYKKKAANKKLERLNFCGFGEDFDLICTGEWVTNDDGVFKQKPNNETGEVDLIEASRMKVVPVETYKNMDTGIEKVKIKFNKYNKWENLICEKITISNITKIVELSNIGIDVNSLNSKDLMAYFYDCLTLNDKESMPHHASISRMGWVENKFMPYSADLVFDGSNEYKHLYESISKKGELKDWVDYVNPLRENLYFRLQMAASFASVLIEKVNALPFVFHLWGGTGSGKTVGLMCAMSIWGNPKMGKLTRTMNMTQNSMMSTAAFLHHLPFAGDELQTIKSRYDNYDQLIMKVTEGVERGRMTFSTINETKTWNCSFLFTGEEPCTKSDSGGGTKNRVIEIECIDKVVENGNKVVNFINDNYGNAGEKFIEVIKDLDIVKDYESIFKEILEKTKTTEKQAMSMALIVLADRLASKHIFNSRELNISEVNEFLFSEKEVDISERAYAFAISLISKNICKFSHDSIEVWGTVPNQHHIFINKQIFMDELSNNGYEFDAIKRKWAEKGYIEKNSQGKFHHSRKINGITTMLIKLNTNVLDDIEQAAKEKEDLCPF